MSTQTQAIRKNETQKSVYIPDLGCCATVISHANADFFTDSNYTNKHYCKR